MSGFIKHDAGKLRMDLVDPVFLEGLARVLTLGAVKYSPRNWQACPEPFERYYAALQRHLNAFAQGQRADEESGLSHLYHAACCLQFLAYFEREGALAGRKEPEVTAEDVADTWRVPLSVPHEEYP